MLFLREGVEIEKIAREILALEEPLETLINCAGVYSKKVYGEITDDEVEVLMSTNVKPIMLLASMLVDRIETDKTDILNVSSTAGIKGDATGPAYSASKWAVRGVTKGMQDYFNGKPNRVVDFCPNGFELDAKMDSGNMRTEDVAVVLKQTLDLPKNMEVSEIIINRK